jgi:CoA:oxalate CoA-transferase
MGATPLKGVRVIDCTHVLAGPFCAYQLGMLGADVIRVERVVASDFIRFQGPREDMNKRGLGVGYLGQGANKRSVCLDLKGEEGQALFKQLSAHADVVVENFRPGKMASLGLGFDDLKALSDNLIYCSITGYGQVGPKRDTPVYDHVMQAVSGFMDLNGSDGQPRRVGFPVIDYLTGLQASQAILAALVERAIRPGPSHIDVSMLESSLSVVNSFAAEVLISGGLRERSPKQALSGSPFSGVFETTEGLLTVTANTVEQASRLTQAIDRPELMDDPRMNDWRAHPELANELAPVFAEVYATASALEWETRLNEAGVPAGKIRDLPEALAHEQLDALGMIQEAGIFEPTGESVRVPGLGMRFDGEAPPVSRFPAEPGQHTDEVLSEIGICAQTLADLRMRGVIA